MIVLIACASIPEFYIKALDLVKVVKGTLSFLGCNEIRSDSTRYLRITTGYEIQNASRVYRDLEVILLPCYIQLPDKLNIDRALNALRNSKSLSH